MQPRFSSASALKPSPASTNVTEDAVASWSSLATRPARPTLDFRQYSLEPDAGTIRCGDISMHSSSQLNLVHGTKNRLWGNAKTKKTDMLRRTSASKKSVKSVLRNRDRIYEKIFEGSMKDFWKDRFLAESRRYSHDCLCLQSITMEMQLCVIRLYSETETGFTINLKPDSIKCVMTLLSFSSTYHFTAIRVILFTFICMWG